MSKIQKNIVRIKKLKGGVNYRISYDYMPMITEFIKNSIPREHWKVHVENTVINGKPKDIWSRDVREFSVGGVISFLLDNSIQFQFVDMTEGEINKLKDDYKKRQLRLREILREKVEGLKIDDMDFSFMKIQPYNYQKQAVKFFEMSGGRAILGDQPGVGKTLVPITYACKNKLKTLVICPASLKINWKKEVEKFTNEKAYIFKFKPSKTSKHKNNTKEESLFHIINYESLDTYMKFEYTHKCSAPKCKYNVTDLEKAYKKCPYCRTPGSVKSRISDIVFFQDDDGVALDVDDYKLLALDECHYIKNEKAQRTKIIKKGLKTIEQKILISGTPIKNRPYEFFPILNFLRPEEFNNSHAFAVKHCAGFEDKFGWNYDGASNLEELFERISPFFLRRLKSDVTELPPKTYINIPIELTDKQMRDYRKLEEGVIEKLAGEDGSGEKKNHLTIIMELRRFVSEIKAKEAIPIIENMIEQGEKVVVFSEFKKTVEIIRDYFKEKAVMIHGDVKMEDRNAAVEAFQNDDEVMVFSGTIGAAGVGLTLTKSSNLINLGLSYSPSDNLQVEDRIHRVGASARKITITTLLCENTVDDDIIELLNNKSTVIDKAIDNKITKKEVETINIGGEFHGGMGSNSIFSQLIKRLINKTSND